MPVHFFKTSKGINVINKIDMNDLNKNAASNFLMMVASGKVNEAYGKYIDANFKHHNAWYKGDAGSLKKGMEENAAQSPDKVLEIKRIIQDGEMVVVHSHIKQNPQDRGAAVVHIFRFSNEKIIELWDVGMAVPENIVNENGMF